MDLRIQTISARVSSLVDCDARACTLLHSPTYGVLHTVMRPRISHSPGADKAAPKARNMSFFSALNQKDASGQSRMSTCQKTRPWYRKGLAQTVFVVYVCSHRWFGIPKVYELDIRPDGPYRVSQKASCLPASKGNSIRHIMQSDVESSLRAVKWRCESNCNASLNTSQ